MKQHPDEQGRTLTTLRWQELDADGTRGEPLTIEVGGSQVYFEGLVLKFAHRHVEEADPQRGSSLVLFRRIFGDRQSPESGIELNQASRPPTPTGGQTDEDASLHARLWSRFWQLVDDPRLAEQYGVRVAQCEAPSVEMRPGQVWELIIDSAGGLNVRKLTDHAPRADADAISQSGIPIEASHSTNPGLLSR